MADGDLLFKARGMNHTIKVIESVNGNAIAYVGSLFGEGSATLTPTERFELAKALYPEAFTGNEVAASWEYSRFRGEEPVSKPLRSAHLVALSSLPGETIKRRIVAGVWQDTSEEDQEQW
jgi:hypothetical protein